MKFILEQVKGARYKLAEHRYIKADQQLSSVQSYCEEIIDKEKPPQNLPKADAYSLLADVRAMTPDDVLKIADRITKEKDSEFKHGLHQGIIIGIKYILARIDSEHFS